MSCLPYTISVSWMQKEVAEFTCTCERHIGTQSGGMDQVIMGKYVSELVEIYIKYQILPYDLG